MYLKKKNDENQCQLTGFPCNVLSAYVIDHEIQYHPRKVWTGSDRFSTYNLKNKLLNIFMPKFKLNSSINDMFVNRTRTSVCFY